MNETDATELEEGQIQDLYKKMGERTEVFVEDGKKYTFVLREITWAREKEIQDLCTFAVSSKGKGDDKVVVQTGKMQMLIIKESVVRAPKGFNLNNIPKSLGAWLSKMCAPNLNVEVETEKNLGEESGDQLVEQPTKITSSTA